MPYSTTSGWQWPPRDRRPMSSGIPTPTTLYMWRRSTSRRWSTSPRPPPARGRDSASTHRPAAFRRAAGLGIGRVALRDTVNSDAVRLDIIPDELRPELAEASQLTESLRLYDSSYHAELSWWTEPFEVTRNPAQLTGVGGRKRPRRRRTQFPGDTHPSADPKSTKTTPRSPCCRHTTTRRQCAAVRRDALRRVA